MSSPVVSTVCGVTLESDEDDAYPRWSPDTQMVAAVLGAPKAWAKMTELGESDRCWLVAGLTLAGMTAKEIAERLGCSLRLVRHLRAQDITQVAKYAQETERRITDELRLEHNDHVLTANQLAEARAQLARVQNQADQLRDALMSGTLKAFPRCGHPRVPYNTYRGRCRECRRKWDTEHRSKGVDQQVRSGERKNLQVAGC